MPTAYLHTAFGGPETETFADLPRPVPGPGRLLIAVRAAGVNPVDWKRRDGYQRAGAAPTVLPSVFGSEAAGVVEEVGPGVEGFAVGDEVFGGTDTGGYAELTLLPAAGTAHKPAALSWTDAATLPVAAATAYDALVQLALPAGATLLVNGVGGGVGVAAAQIARHRGLTVIGTASAAKRSFAQSLGVIHVPSGEGVADRVRAAAPGGVDGILDLVGGDSLRELADLLADRSHLVSGADKALAASLGGSAIVRARTGAVLSAVAALVVEGALDPYVTRTFPLAEADKALRAVEQGHTRGKIALTVDR
ncbi:NADP-dependent oxidoreductase [Actinacidiphila paucisporea]|uniref:NADPH:quinone reductase n=1 Tax=Actinacidiphila paucisporea TaxID=310782 RepID=A0A1M7GR36_9ACTN|nr:NADP-dependent oxidoreductase [Actinacidiphila paucisporea]SHM18641.1 NADPH:quinone reductase [Actinacidiphila paucisporea]